MITEKALSELFGSVTDDVEVPDQAASRFWEQSVATPDAAAAVAPVSPWRRLPGRSGIGWTRHQTIRWVGAAAALVLVVGAVGAGIGLTSSGNSQRSNATSAVAPGDFAEGKSGQGSAGAVAGGPAVGAPAPSGPTAPLDPNATDRRVVKNASLSLQVGDGKVPDTLDRLRALPASYNGFVSSSDSNLTGTAPSGTVGIRVPIASYDALRNALSDGKFGKVTSVTESGSDVTGQYTDIVARLAALNVSRQTYLTMLSKATNIGDTLAVQQKLDAVQQEIEQLQGQQKLLADQSDYATFNVTVSESGRVAVAPASRNGFSKAGHDAWDGFTGGLEWLVSITGVLAVVLLFAGVIGFGGRYAVRRVRRTLV